MCFYYIYILGRNYKPPSKTPDLARSPPKEVLSYAESQKYVQFEIEGKIAKIALDEPLAIPDDKDFDLLKGNIQYI